MKNKKCNSLALKLYNVANRLRLRQNLPLNEFEALQDIADRLLLKELKQ